LRIWLSIVLLLLIATCSVAIAGPRAPAIADVKVFALNDDGTIRPYTQDSIASTLLLGVKISSPSGTSTSLPLTFTGVADNSAAYHEANVKPPPPRAVRVTRKVRLASGEQWVYLMIEMDCYHRMAVQLGEAKKPLDTSLLPGSCF